MNCTYDARSAVTDWQHKIHAPVYVTVGMSTCGIAAGARETLQAVETELSSRGLQAVVNQVGCVGMCSYEPMIELQATGRSRVNYGAATSRNVREVFAHYFDGGELRRAVVVGEIVPTVTERSGSQLHSLSFMDPDTGERIAFQAKQERIVLSNCGLINPESIDEYLAVDGYRALERAVVQMSPEDVIEEVMKSGLRGRGGGGFPAALKWKLARQTQSWPKYVICNADEGDPGAFMDRSVLEGDPHSVIEGMIIAGLRHRRGTRLHLLPGGVSAGDPSPEASRWIRRAQLGLLGDDILGSGFSFDLQIKEGAGAFVCGEETALMASIMGERGQPWPRPPYPAVAGVWDQPSNVNNVKSYAYTPRILRLGADWFRSLGTEGSPGTAVFALTGQVERTGLIEVAMGITVREIIEDVGGGVALGKHFKAVQTGGPLGGCLPEQYLDTPVDFDSLRAIGRGDGIRRHDRGRRDHLHGGVRPLFHEVRGGRKLRQVPALPHRQPADAGNPGPHHRGRGHAGRPGRAAPALGRACSAARCADWASLLRRRCCRCCASSRTSSAPTSSTKPARPTSARR